MRGDYFWRDVKYGLRGLMRNPAFSAVALVTLGLGIGANAAIFSVVNTVLLRPLPFRDSQRIVMARKVDLRRNILNGTASPAEYLDWRTRNHSFEQLAGFNHNYYNLAGAAEPEQVWGARVTPNFFSVFQVTPIVGRGFLPEEEQPGHGQTALLSYRFWQEHFGGRSDALGRSITVDGNPYTVVGVLPAEFNLWGNEGWQYDLWMPFTFEPKVMDRNEHMLTVFGRMRPGVTAAQAESEMKAIVRQLQQEYPGIDKGVDVRVAAMHAEATRALRPALEKLLGVAGLVLLIACVNIANLLLSRATSREREMAVRTSLGAGRGRLLAQVLTESVLLGVSGGAVGLALGFGGLKLLPLFLPAAGSLNEIPYAHTSRIDADVLAFTLAVSVATGILFGLAPAFQISQSRLNEALKEGGRGGAGGRRGNWLRSLLVVVEVAASLVLLAGAGLLTRSFVNVLSEKLGYDAQNLLTLQISLPDYRYKEPAQFLSFFREVSERVKRLPGVESAGMIDYLPLTRWIGHINFQIAGAEPRARGEELTTQYRAVDAGYMSTMRIPLLKGRELTDADAEQGAKIALVNATFARQFFQNENPVGKQIRFLPEARAPYEPMLNASWLTIAGVVGDTTEGDVGEPTPAILYVPYLQNPSPLMRLAIRTTSDPMSLAAGVRHEVEAVDKDQPVSEVKTMEELVEALASRRRLNMTLVAFFAALATALAGVGIYGVISYSVTQQTHDLGIRMALGAQPRDVLGLVVRQGMRLAMAGIAVGLVAGIFILRWALTPILFGLSSMDPAVLAGTAVVLALIALVACYVPARRATRVDPLDALRYE
ncbi:MAG TPA: ABC transporter permease [Candidatus Acidoferrales bacterium]|nr:ABC transporter permease [Candidatus Acidoferrales bacterium]